jgi:hypothetical protein
MEEGEEYYLPGAHAARMLHRVRRAERMLLSYERTGALLWRASSRAGVRGSHQPCRRGSHQGLWQRGAGDRAQQGAMQRAQGGPARVSGRHLHHQPAAAPSPLRRPAPSGRPAPPPRLAGQRARPADRPQGDPPRRRAGPHHPVPGHLGLHAGREGDGGQGACSGVHAGRAQVGAAGGQGDGPGRALLPAPAGGGGGCDCPFTHAPRRAAHAPALLRRRAWRRQQRACYLYAFSGPGEVQELELSVDPKSMGQLLDFLSGAFMGEAVPAGCPVPSARCSGTRPAAGAAPPPSACTPCTRPASCGPGASPAASRVARARAG